MVKLDVKKSADKNYVFIGISNVIRYSISITNSGDERVGAIKIKDPLSNGISFIPGTLSVNGCIKDKFISDPINIGYMDPGENIIISFAVKVEPNYSSNFVTNKAIVTYLDKYNNAFSTESNEVITQIVIIDVCVIKSADRKIAKVGEIISYSVLIRNAGNVDITDVVFYDELPKKLVLLPASVLIESVPQYVENFNGGMVIGTIKAKSSVVVSFQVEVVSLPCPQIITNVAQVDYNYTIYDNQIPVTSIGETSSNCVETKIIFLGCNC